MIAAAAATTGRLRRWLSVRHSLGLEAALVVALYGVYELARGLVVGDTKEADRHADQLVALERSLHLVVEGKVQHAADALPGLAGLLGVAYLTLHLAVTSRCQCATHCLPPKSWPRSAARLNGQRGLGSTIGFPSSHMRGAPSFTSSLVRDTRLASSRTTSSSVASNTAFEWSER
jgi:hypothetical protein